MSALALASCLGETKESPNSNKETLQKDGFTVSVYTAEEYRQTTTYAMFTDPKGLENQLTSIKTGGVTNPFSSAWYFDNFDHADAWMRENFSALSGIARGAENSSYGVRKT